MHSFHNRTDMTTDLNHYKDGPHYGEWVNSLILKWMHDGALDVQCIGSLARESESEVSVSDYLKKS